jgi:DNA-binding CsgD family transcriptional regulator
MSEHLRRRSRDQIIELSREGLDLPTFWQESGQVLARAVPHYMGACWYTLDPTSLLITSHYNPHMPVVPPEWLALEYYEDDFYNTIKVARSERGLSTLHEATGGDPSRSPRWELYMRPSGGEQELLLALRTQSGGVWGMLGLYRESGQPLFDEGECRFLQGVAPYLAEGARCGLLVGEATDPEGPESPGLVVLREDWSVESLTPGTAHLLDELPGGNWTAHGKLPSAVLAVAGQALRTAEHADAPGEVALARVQTPSGQWLVLHGAALVAGGARRCAVIIESAQGARIASLLMSAYALTEREQEVTRLVLQGNSTSDIAERLAVSDHTVQQHLKSIFDKTGVRSRRELIGQVFFSYYEPRVRDNEGRVDKGRPMRGGPLERRPKV